MPNPGQRPAENRVWTKGPCICLAQAEGLGSGMTNGTAGPTARSFASWGHRKLLALRIISLSNPALQAGRGKLLRAWLGKPDKKRNKTCANSVSRQYEVSNTPGEPWERVNGVRDCRPSTGVSGKSVNRLAVVEAVKSAKTNRPKIRIRSSIQRAIHVDCDGRTEHFRGSCRTTSRSRRQQEGRTATCDTLQKAYDARAFALSAKRCAPFWQLPRLNFASWNPTRPVCSPAPFAHLPRTQLPSVATTFDDY